MFLDWMFARTSLECFSCEVLMISCFPSYKQSKSNHLYLDPPLLLVFVAPCEMWCFFGDWYANVWTLLPNLRQCSKTFCGCRTMDWRMRAATTAKRLYSTNKLNAAVESVSPSQNLRKPGRRYKFRAKLPNEMAAVDSLCKNKSESPVLLKNSFLCAVPQESDPLLNILYWSAE